MKLRTRANRLWLALMLGRVRMYYTAVYRTREFAGQDSNDLFGVVNLGWRF